MSEEYYSFQERFPGARALGTGMVIGTLAAIAASSGIALAQFASGAPWKELLGTWGMMTALMIPVFAPAFGAGFLAHHYRRVRHVLTGGPMIEAGSIAATRINADAITTYVPEGQRSLAETVVQNANDQAFWHYERGWEPTRRAMELQGVSQTVWNSGRHILTTAKIVKGKEWASRPYELIERALDNIHAEHDRVWVRPLGERTLVCLHIDEQAVNKRYTRHPTPPTQEPEHNQDRVGSAGSEN